MRKLVSVQLLAAASLAVAFPLVASASSYAEEKAYEQIRQPLDTGSSESSQRNDTNEFAFKTIVFSGESYAMNEIRQRIHEETSNSKQLESENADDSAAHSRNSNSPHGRDW
jgi:hypothetical protein